VRPAPNQNDEPVQILVANLIALCRTKRSRGRAVVRKPGALTFEATKELD